MTIIILIACSVVGIAIYRGIRPALIAMGVV